MFRLAYQRWKLFGEILGDFQGHAIAFLFYATIMIPFGVGARLFGDTLALKQPAHWVERPPVGTSLEEAQRQG